MELERDNDITWASGSYKPVVEDIHDRVDMLTSTLNMCHYTYWERNLISPPVFFDIALPNVSMKWKLKFI